MTAAARLFETARAAGLSIEVDGADLVIETDRAIPPDLLDDLRQHKAELIAVLVPPSRASTPTDPDELDELAALIEFGANVPRRWAEGYAALCSMTPPAGFSSERWARIVDAAGVFLDRWAADAIRCGWSDLDTFGCDRDRPDARFDAMGLVMLLDRMEVVGIDPDGADLIATAGGAKLRFRRRPLPRHTILLWDLDRS